MHISIKYKGIHKISNLVEKILEVMVAILCVVLLSALFIQVMNRYVFGVSWPILQFIIPLCFIWMSMIGAGLAVKRNQHFEVDMLSKNFKGNLKLLHATVFTLLVILGGVIILVPSVQFLKLGLIKNSPAVSIKMVYIYASLFFGAMLIILAAIERFLNMYVFRISTDKEIQQDTRLDL